VPSHEISTELREFVAARAKQRCEYCLLAQRVALHKHEVDHIVPQQHGGESVVSNLALACMRCNRYKGPNVGSFDPGTNRLVAFYDPRSQEWSAHFELEGAVIRPLTAEARVTIKILRLNDDERVKERAELLRAGLYA
jgi:HNH endonuclease